MLFIDYVNVLFSSNSQLNSPLLVVSLCCLSIMSMFSFQAIHNGSRAGAYRARVVYRLCQCSLFKQFTTLRYTLCVQILLFIDYVNVLFSSNSQLAHAFSCNRWRCLSIMSMFSFQAIHNSIVHMSIMIDVVYRLCQCSLFKQFTTRPSRL